MAFALGGMPQHGRAIYLSFNNIRTLDSRAILYIMPAGVHRLNMSQAN